ncbi:hypothetical protein Cni_G15981 [Canna indica]|uniref:DC1 domain-containing protein n=1 Tax=Canna indica TaxID=4628 RepID=A0AAQ3KEQ2_9LILI|nr:hypothetical protein Cni_G15981 [Canna indica]
MGRLGYDPRINHFSHPHPLELISIEESPQVAALQTCAGCTFPASGWAYACHPCNYALHVSCAQMPQRIRHPSHPDHSLTLLPVPAYKEDSFNCDACGRDGAGFSYHCDACGIDFHSLCASMPLSVSHAAHMHPLSLVFFVPYDDGGFSCDICAGVGANHWLYRCAMCEFDAHIGCATAKPTQLRATPRPQQPVQRGRQPLPSPMQSVAQVRGSMGAGVMVNNGAWQGRPADGMLSQQQQQQVMMMNGAGRGRGGAGGLANQIIQGLVNRTSQQIGQSLVQNIFGGGGDGG